MLLLVSKTFSNFYHTHFISQLVLRIHAFTLKLLCKISVFMHRNMKFILNYCLKEELCCRAHYLEKKRDKDGNVRSGQRFVNLDEGILS